MTVLQNIDAATAAYLRRTGMTQAQLAKKMGLAPNTFSWKRRGIREFTLSEAERLCKIIGYSLDDAIKGEATA